MVESIESETHGRGQRFVEAPTLYPSEEEFKDPIGFLSLPANIKLAEQYGILKLVPPRGWRPPFSINKDTFKFHTRLQNLRELNLDNRPRIFFFESLNNFLKMLKKETVTETPIPLLNGGKIDLYTLFVVIDYELNNKTENAAGLNWKKINGYFGLAADDRQLKSIYDKNLKGYCKYLKKRKRLFDTQRQDNSINTNDDAQSDYCLICYKADDPQRTLICDGCEESYHMKCLDPPLKKIPDGDWYCDSCLIGTFDYGFEEDFDSLFTINQFEKHCKKFEDKYFLKHFGTTERPSLNVLEHEFWKLVEGVKVDDEDKELEVRYGADIHSDKLDEISGFPTLTNQNIDQGNSEVLKYVQHPFNLTNLPFADGSLLRYIRDSEISGMTVPWIYVGSLFSTFCWHKEDHYTLSSNYCHFGSTKKWYGIPAQYESLFEQIVVNCAPDYFKRQPDLLHQLVTLLSPGQIFDRANGNDLTIVYANQNENEFIITYPKVYHAGFNTGLNFNELVNFTMPYWVNDADRAISDYKKVHKENVFNYYQLSYRIMDEFLRLTGPQISSLNNRYKDDYIKMINLCLRDFTKEFNSSNKLNSQLTGLSSLINEVRYQPGGSANNENGEKPRRKRGRKKVEKEEELLCDVCKTFLCFRWVSLDNKLASETSNKGQGQLLTPKQTPSFADDGSHVCEENEFQRIISEARKLSEITNDGSRSLGLGFNSSVVGDEIKKEVIESTKESLKRRRSRRLELKPAQKDDKFSSDQDKEPSKKKQKLRQVNVKLCLHDFFKLLDSEVYGHHKKLFRSFDDYEDFNAILRKYGTLYYDFDEAETYKFICDVNAKLNKILYK